MVDEVIETKTPRFASQQFRRPDNRGYGQNQFGGSSSDMDPRKPTVSGFLPACDLEAGKRVADGAQSKPLPKSSKPAPHVAYGMKDSNLGGAPRGSVPAKLGTPVTPSQPQPIRKP